MSSPEIRTSQQSSFKPMDLLTLVDESVIVTEQDLVEFRCHVQPYMLASYDRLSLNEQQDLVRVSRLPDNVIHEVLASHDRDSLAHNIANRLSKLAGLTAESRYVNGNNTDADENRA